MRAIEVPPLTRRSALGFTGAALALSAATSAKALAQPQGNTQPTGGSTTGCDVMSFGAKGDCAPDGSSGTDDTAAIQAALDYLDSRGGGTLHFPEGNYLVTSPLRVPNYTELRGAGRRASKLVGTHSGGGGTTAAESTLNGSILYNAQPINTSPAAHIALYNLWVHNANSGNQGAGFYHQSGDSVLIRDCEFSGSKWGVILDQSEDVSITGCELSSYVSGGAGLWLVNGPDLTPGASAGFTNIVNVRDCHINVLPGSYGVIDDGGYEHCFDGCDFNGGVTGLRAANAEGLTVSSCYFEGQTSDILTLNSTALSGTEVGGCIATVIGGQFSPTPGNSVIRGTGAPGELTIIGGCWSCHQPALANTNLFWSVALINPGLEYYPKVPFCDGSAAGLHFEPARIRSTADGKVGVPNTAGGTGGATLTPGTNAGFIEIFNGDGARQGYGFFLADSGLHFEAEGLATHFRFLAPMSCAGSITSTGGALGYAPGAGGTVVQAPGKSTDVTLDKPSGQITMSGESLAAMATASFKLTNNLLGPGDVLILNHVAGGTIGAYNLNAHGATVGSVRIDVTNITAGALAEAIVVRYAVIKGAMR